MKTTRKSLARRDKIKAAALELFLSKGYENTSLKDINAKSGGSMSDIYHLFKNKQHLFFSVIYDIIQNEQKISSKLLKKGLNLREFLREFASLHLGRLDTKNARNLFKIVLSQLYNASSAELVEYFKEAKELTPERSLIEFFKTCEKPLCTEPERYAELFFTLMKGPFFAKIVFDLPTKKGEKEAHIDFVVDFFLNGIKSS